MTNNHIVIGRNAVREALSADVTVEKVLLQESGGKELHSLFNAAREASITVEWVPKKVLDRKAQGGVHQGAIAITTPFEYSTVEDILNIAKDRGEDPFVIVLDGIEDPHNLGAIMRSAECAGVHGIIIPKRGGCLVNETVWKTSAGATSYMACAKVTNVARTVEFLQEAGLWVGACTMGPSVHYKTNLTGPLAIVIGNEGKGISRLVESKCDFTVSIPMKGQINSLNASNAAAIVMYEALRQRETQSPNKSK